MNTPNELRYTRSDEWVRIEGEVATLGITDQPRRLRPGRRRQAQIDRHEG